MLRSQEVKMPKRGERARLAQQRMAMRDVGIEPAMPPIGHYTPTALVGAERPRRVTSATQADAMIVTMTQGELSRLMSGAVEEAVSRVMDGMEERIAALMSSDTLAGVDEITAFLGVSKDTFYSELKKGTFGDAVKHVGRKVMATRSGLMAALSNNKTKQ